MEDGSGGNREQRWKGILGVVLRFLLPIFELDSTRRRDRLVLGLTRGYKRGIRWVSGGV